MANVQTLRVWHVGLEIVGLGQRLVVSLPKAGAGELRSQMTRAAISIPSNLAEGAGRGTDPEFKRFIAIALGSCRELETQLHIVRRMRIGDRDCCEQLVDRVDHEGRMLTRLIQAL